VRLFTGPVIGGPWHGISLSHGFPIYRVLNVGSQKPVLIDNSRYASTIKNAILGEYTWDDEEKVWQWKTTLGGGAR
jgi:hypothetical protein